jgi:hypothetical protein
MKSKLTTRQLATIFRLGGFVIAAFFLYKLRSGEGTMPQEGFMGSTFCNLMAAVGALVFTIGSVMRFRDIMKNNNNPNPN